MTRRSMIPLLGVPALATAQQLSASSKINKLETFIVKVNHRGNWVLTRLTTSDGISGIGDASHGGKDAIVLEHMRALFERLKGLSIWDMERFRQESFPELTKAGRNAVVAFSALEQCCWDIRGKVLGRPVYDLLGGKIHDRIRNYANINRAAANRDPQTFGDLGGKAAAAGFDAIKMASFDGMPKTDAARIREHTDRGVACIEAVRKAAGQSVDLLVDGHGNFTLESALDVTRRLEPQRLSWLEEMIPGVQGLAAFNRAITVPTAGGENIFGTHGFYPYMSAGAADIMMPDLKYCGGVLELKKIAAMAEGAGLKISPHGPASPVGNAAAAHVCATLPNFLILEMAFGENPWRAEVIDPPENVVKGYITVKDKPGFGIKLNDAVLKRYSA